MQIKIDNDFETILVCAARYALPRHTYMPDLVIDYVTPLIPYLSNKCVATLWRDILLSCQDDGYSDKSQKWLGFVDNLSQQHPDCEPYELRKQKRFNE